MDIYIRIAGVIGLLLLVGLMYYGVIRTIVVYMASHDDDRKWRRFVDSWSGVIAVVGSFLVVAIIPMLGFFLVLMLVLADDFMRLVSEESVDRSSK